MRRLVTLSLSSDLSVTPVYRPIAHAGSVQTQGDAVIQADVVRDLYQDGVVNGGLGSRFGRRRR